MKDVRRLAGTIERESGATAAVTRDTLRLYQQTGKEVGTASVEATDVMKTTSPVLVETLGQIHAASATTNRLLKALGGTLLFDLAEPEEESAPVGAEPAAPEQSEAVN